MDRPPLIEAEILPPNGPGIPPPQAAGDGFRAKSVISEPYHPAAAALLVLVDNLWMLPEFAMATWLVTIPLCFLSVFFITLVIQFTLGRNKFFASVAKALFFGIVAALPFSVTGTPVGLAFLAWAGVKRLSR